ncbi:MAG: KOW domain-containing RNA-binding protein [Clostridia bacterium]|nr:KOW domain-containing RNA-binding protein [Clostridia bacterium]
MGLIEKGTVVLVTAGKEKGSIFVVVEDFNSRQVWIADGRRRKLANPRKKSVKHLVAVGKLAALPERDRLIWKSLSPYRG